MKGSRLRGVLLCLAALSPSAAAAATPQDLQEQLNRVRQDLRQERQGLKEMREQIRRTEQNVQQQRKSPKMSFL